MTTPWTGAGCQGATGDALHAVLYAAGYNFRWLLRAIVRLGLKGLFAPLLALLATLATALAAVLGEKRRLGWDGLVGWVNFAGPTN
jgi:hypothetical protein